MYCNKCGRPIKPHYKCKCPACLYRDTMDSLSMDEIYERTRAVSEKQKRDRRVANVILFILFPYVMVFVWLFKLYSSNYVSSTTSNSKYGGGGSSLGGYSSSSESSDCEKFTYGDADGNVHETGKTFVDFAGNVLEWGSPFVDGRGNTVGWGEPFYDGRGNYVTWGSPFYDARGNYINPRR